MSMTITKEFHFGAAHHLPNYDGKCNNIHGHEYFVRVEFKRIDGETKGNGMIVDFSKIKSWLEPVENDLDHAYLNNIEGLENPTAENTARYIAARLKQILSILREEEIKLESVQVWETPTSYVTWRTDND